MKKLISVYALIVGTYLVYRDAVSGYLAESWEDIGIGAGIMLILFLAMR